MAQITGQPAETELRLARMKGRLNTTGWALLLMWTGTLILLPGDLAVLWHIWLLGVGAIVLGTGVVALRVGITPGWDNWILGIVCAVSGSAGLLGVSVSVIGLAMLLFGLGFLAAVIRAAVTHPMPPSPASPSRVL